MLLRVFESQLAAKCSPSCSFLPLGRIRVYVLISAVGPGGVGWETLPRLLRKKLLWESEWKTQNSSLAFFLCLSQYPARRLVCSGYPGISGELCYGSAVWFSAWGSSPCCRGTVWRQSFSQCPRHSHSCSVSGGEPQPLCAWRKFAAEFWRLHGVCKEALCTLFQLGSKHPISLVHRVQQLLVILTMF